MSLKYDGLVRVWSPEMKGEKFRENIRPAAKKASASKVTLLGVEDVFVFVVYRNIHMHIYVRRNIQK